MEPDSRSYVADRKTGFCCINLLFVSDWKEGGKMVMFLMGAVFGILICLVAGMVAYCIHTEHQYPEIRAHLFREMEEVDMHETEAGSG